MIPIPTRYSNSNSKMPLHSIRSSPTPTPPPRPRTASPRTAAIAAEALLSSNINSATNHHQLSKSSLLRDGWSSRTFKLVPHKPETNSYSDCRDVGVGAVCSLPLQDLPVPNGNYWLPQSLSNEMLQGGPTPLPSANLFCRENEAATTVSAASSSPGMGASRSSTSVAAPSSKLKPGKKKTIMCQNLPHCRFGKNCTFAHSDAELRSFTLDELRLEQKRPIDYLSYPCFDFVSCGAW